MPHEEKIYGSCANKNSPGAIFIGICPKVGLHLKCIYGEVVFYFFIEKKII